MFGELLDKKDCQPPHLSERQEIIDKETSKAMSGIKPLQQTFGLMLVLSLMVTCGGTPEEQTPAPTSLTMEVLRNAEYQSEWPASGKARLTDGSYREKYVPGAATELVIRLSDHHAIGDLNGDGAKDAVVILVSNPGGSGTFYDLAVLVSQNGSPKHVATKALGDRIVVKSLAIHSGEIAINLLVRKPDQPMSAEPKVEVTKKFKLREDKLVEDK
jgi:hypothetical protein